MAYKRERGPKAETATNKQCPVPAASSISIAQCCPPTTAPCVVLQKHLPPLPLRSPTPSSPEAAAILRLRRRSPCSSADAAPVSSLPLPLSPHCFFLSSCSSNSLPNPNALPASCWRIVHNPVAFYTSFTAACVFHCPGGDDASSRHCMSISGFLDGEVSLFFGCLG